MRFITLNSFMISFKCVYPHRYIGMFADFFFIPYLYPCTLPSQWLNFLQSILLFAVQIQQLLLFNLSSLSFFVDALENCMVKQLKGWWFISWIALSKFEQPGPKVYLGGGGGGLGGCQVQRAGRCIFLQVKKEVYLVGRVYGHSRGTSTTIPKISPYSPQRAVLIKC